MPWNWVFGQERAVDILRRSVAGGRIAHAYLFHGPEGTGKRAAALAMAQALQCERREEGQDDACGECAPCSKVARMLHPDVQLHLALPSSHQKSTTTDPGKAQLEDIAARLQILAGDPYAEVSYRRRPDLSDPAKSSNLRPFYSVERVREDINRSLRYTPAEGRFKVVILTDADTMRVEAANTLLKTLEEPNPRTVLVLTATRPDALLPTIVSRCQRLRFESLPAPDVERALAARGAATPEEAPLIARMAGGSITQALALAGDEGLAERRAQVLAFLRLCIRGGVDELDAAIKGMAGLGREPLRDVLTLMLAWTRDVVVTRASNGEAAVVNVDQLESIRRFVHNLPEARLSAMVSLIEHAIELLGGNVNPTLILINLADGLRAAMNGQERGRLFEPLAG